MTERGILYSTPMILAKLAGTKTQTRRTTELDLVNALDKVSNLIDKSLRFIGDSRSMDVPRPAIKYDNRIWFLWSEGYRTDDATIVVPCPWSPGDILYGRETWYRERDGCPVFYKADWPTDARHTPKWKPSIHLPKNDSRIWERITEIRVQRLSEITEEDALAEGVVWSDEYQSFHVPGVEHRLKEFPWFSRPTAREMYAALWDTIHGSGAWLRDSSSWAWVITTEILSTTGRPEKL